MYYTVPITEHFLIFFANKILYFIRSEGYTFRRNTFSISALRFIRSDVIR